MAQLPLNETFGALADTSFKMGANINKMRDVSGQNPQKFAGVASAVQGASAGTRAPSGQAPTDLSSLGTVTVPYGGSTRYESGGAHTGIDIANKMGTPIPDLAGGKVVEARTGYKQDPSKPSWGNTVVIKDSNGNFFRYSHLNDVYVKVGDQTSKGGVIGTMGNTGSTYSMHGGDGTHLDLRIFNAAKKFYNPQSYLSNLMK